MSELGAVREWEKARVWYGPTIASSELATIIAKADAAIAVLKRLLAEEKLSKKCAVNILEIERQDARQRAEKAEAARAKTVEAHNDIFNQWEKASAEIVRLTWREKELHEFLNWKPRDAQDRYIWGPSQPKGSFKQVREFIDCLEERWKSKGS